MGGPGLFEFEPKGAFANEQIDGNEADCQTRPKKQQRPEQCSAAVSAAPNCGWDSALKGRFAMPQTKDEAGEREINRLDKLNLQRHGEEKPGKNFSDVPCALATD